MTISEQYSELTAKINDNLPIKAFPIRELVHIHRKDTASFTLKTELTITSAHNSGDISGIMCTVETNDGYALACALTFLIIPRSEKFAAEIAEYQKKREKRLKQLRAASFN